MREEGGFVLHRSPAWFMVDDGKKTMAPLGLRGQKLSAGCTFMIADTAFIDEMTDIFGEMGITIMGFLSPSLGEALLLLSLDDRDRAALLIDVGYLSTEVSAVEGDAIVYHAILPLGGGHITAEIATDLAIPMRAAEQLKRGYVFNPDEFDKDAVTEVRGPGGRRIAFSRDEIAPSVQRVMDEICDMIDQTVRTDAGAHLGSRSQIFLTGGGISLMRGGREYLAERLGRPVKVPVAKSAKMNSPIYSSAMGLVDLIFDSIEQRDDTVGMGGKFKFSLFKKG